MVHAQTKTAQTARRGRSGERNGSALPQAPVPRGLREKGELQDVHGMFTEYNARFFSSSLDGVYVEYSSRMTLCAGTCTYTGAAGGCRIALSKHLLERRPVRDTRDTLLHEMIHASLFLKHGMRRDGPDGHGPLFLAEAARVNREAGSNITVYHSFTDEVAAQRKHWWRCGGCAKVVKRAQNRAPSPLDLWWPSHMRDCSGSFVKTHEPPPKAPPRKTPKLGAMGVAHDEGDTGTGVGAGTQTQSGVMRVRRIDDMLHGICTQPRKKSISASQAAGKAALARASQTRKLDGARNNTAGRKLSCPVCNQQFDSEAAVSQHLDTECLAEAFSQVPAPAATTASVHRVYDVDIEEVEEVEDVDDEGSGNAVSKWDRFVTEDSHVPSWKPSAAARRDDLRGGERPRNEPGPVLKDRPRDSGPVTTAVDGITGEPRKASVGTVVVPDEGHDDVICLDGDETAVDVEAREAKRLRLQFMTDDLLDFGLGLGDAFLPSETRESLAKHAPRPQPVEYKKAIPDLPIRKKMTQSEALKETTQKLGLWHPTGNPDDPPFAFAAARRGMSPAEFKSKLQSLSTLEDGKCVLSSEAEKLFLPLETPFHVGAMSCAGQGSMRRNGNTSDPHGTKRGKTLDMSKAAQHEGAGPSGHLKIGGANRSNVFGGKSSKGPQNQGGRYSGSGVQLAPERPVDLTRNRRGGRGSHPSLPGDGPPTSRPAQRGASDMPQRAAVQSEDSRPSSGRSTAITSSVFGIASQGVGTEGQIAASMATCPMCEKKVPREQMDSHLTECISFDDDDDVVEIVKVTRTLAAPQQVPSHRLTAPLEQNVPRTERRTGDLVSCPICNRSLPREELQEHTGRCLTSSGLDDAF